MVNNNPRLNCCVSWCNVTMTDHHPKQDSIRTTDCCHCPWFIRCAQDVPGRPPVRKLHSTVILSASSQPSQQSQLYSSSCFALNSNVVSITYLLTRSQKHRHGERQEDTMNYSIGRSEVPFPGREEWNGDRAVCGSKWQRWNCLSGACPN